MVISHEKKMGGKKCVQGSRWRGTAGPPASAAPFSAARAAVNTRPGAYDREMVRHLGDYADRDTELYAAAVQLYEERLAAARQGKTCI